MNPFLMLNLPLDATDAQIRDAYLQGVKEFPPDADPIQFQAIAAAYEAIKDQDRRHNYYLWNRAPHADSPLDAAIRYGRLRRRLTPLSFEAMKDFLRSCSKT